MMAEQTVELLPNESKVISFQAIPHEAKTYQVVVDGLEGSFSAVAPKQLVVRAYYKGMAWMNVAIKNNKVTYDSLTKLDSNYHGVTTDWQLYSTFILPVDVTVKQIEFDALFTYGYNIFDYQWTAERPGQAEEVLVEGDVSPNANNWSHFTITVK